MKKEYKVIIIGGGASGMATAIAANTRDILIIEANPRLGKKLLATGNGKCNLLNWWLSPQFYNDGEFVAPIFDRYGVDKMIEFFARQGLIMRFDDEGRGYPISESAATVLDVLRRAVEKKADVLCDNTVSEIAKIDGCYTVTTNKGESFTASKIVFAAGSNAGFGTDSLNVLNGLVRSRHFTPSLAPLNTDTAPIAGLNGVRAKCRASLVSGGKVLSEETGEILFKTFGLSGIVSFNLSAAYVRAGCPADAYVSLDLLDDAKDFFAVRATGRTASEYLLGVFHKMLNLALLKYVGVGENDRVTPEIAERLYNAACDFRIAVKGVGDVSLAQVSSGGVLTSEVNKNTLEAKGAKGLFFTGEALDIDGVSGGYNLMWAWASAFAVAESLN